VGSGSGRMFSFLLQSCEDLICEIVSFLTLRDIAILDSSLCNHILRVSFLAIMRRDFLSRNSPLSIVSQGQLSWMTTRRLLTKSLLLNTSVDYSSYLNLNLENLESLHIESCIPNERERLLVSQCSNLKILRIFHCGMSDLEFYSLFDRSHSTPSLISLTALTVHGYSQPTVHSLRTICQCCPSLEVLVFHLFTPLSGVDIPMIISSLPLLRVLSIGTNLSNDSVCSLLSAFPGINLSFRNLDDIALELQVSILRNQLTSLDLNNTRVFVTKFLDFLIRHPTFDPSLISDFIPRIIQIMAQCLENQDSLKQVSFDSPFKKLMLDCCSTLCRES
jgi:hypothetical protein